MVTEANSAVDASVRNAFGQRIMELADLLARWSETSDGLTCTYLSPAHRAVAAQLRDWMRQAGMTAEIDAAGNVVGRLRVRRAGGENADHRLALRHRAQRRQV